MKIAEHNTKNQLVQATGSHRLPSQVTLCLIGVVLHAGSQLLMITQQTAPLPAGHYTDKR
jgi:hypothetical protein